MFCVCECVFFNLSLMWCSYYLSIICLLFPFHPYPNAHHDFIYIYIDYLFHKKNKLWGQYYRDVLATPTKDDHQNIRNFMKYGWDGVDFANGIALTKKCVGGNDWDWDSESFIP